MPDNLKQDYLFVPTKVGMNKIMVKVVDNVGLEKIHEIAYNAILAPFTFLMTPNLGAYIVNEPGAFTSNLVRKEEDTFKFTYMVENGTGVFFDGDTEIKIGQSHSLASGVLNLKYKPQTLGQHKIIATAKAIDGAQVTRTVEILVENVPFNFLFSSDLGNYTNNALGAFTATLVRRKGDTFEFTYMVENGTGVFFDGDTEIKIGEPHSLASGVVNLKYKPQTLGKHKITAKAKAIDGVEITKIVDILVDNVPFSFKSSSAENNSIFINSAQPLNFEISETKNSGTTFEMKHEVLSGEATIKNGSIAESINAWYPVSLGSFNRSFVGKVSGPVKVLFTVRNKTTLVEKTIPITINVKASEFSFEANRTSDNQVTNSDVNVNLNLAQTGGANDVYNLRFTTSGTGTFKYKGVEYTAGQIIPFVNGSSNGTYKGKSAGAHNITFTATNQFYSKKNASVNLNFIRNDFTLSVIGTGTVLVNQHKDINVIVHQLIPDPSMRYSVKFSFENGSSTNGHVLRGGNPIPLGSYSPVSLGNDLFHFKGLSAGNVTLLIEVEDNNRIRHSSSISLNIKNTEFYFSGALKNPNGFTGMASEMVFELSEPSRSGTNFEVMYRVVSGNPTVRDGERF